MKIIVKLLWSSPRNYAIFFICIFLQTKYPLNTFNAPIDLRNRCRWSPYSGDPTLFVKYDLNKLNILDVQKNALTFRNQIDLDSKLST